MNKNKWNSLPADVKKVIADFSKEFNERWDVEWNKIDIEGKEFLTQQGGQILPLSDAESARWIKAVDVVVADYKKDVISKGAKAADVDTWLAYVKERIEYWKGQEKAQKIPTVYQY
jgi:TRAP-type C4-dicarboxylate transport system substrate-binding protein